MNEAPAFRYKGMPCFENPLDVAFYQTVIGELCPRTIIAVGANQDGSALWFANAMQALPLPPNVHIVGGETTMWGDLLTPEVLRTLPRPWLIAETVDRPTGTTLTFFRDWLEIGDGISLRTASGLIGFESDQWFGRHHYMRCRSARTPPDPGPTAERRARNLEIVKNRTWFYEFDLPGGIRTAGWPPDVQPIHPSRRDKLRAIIDRRVDPQDRSAVIDLGAHNGYFSFELARHFARVDAYELRPESVREARILADALGIDNVTFTETDLSCMEPHPALTADFVLMYGLLYHVEDPLRLLRLAARLARKHILIETAVFPFDMTGRIDAGRYTHQRNIEGVFGLTPDFPASSVGGQTRFALVPSLNALLCIMRELGFAELEVLEAGPDDYEQFRRGSRVVVHGMKP